MTLKLNGLSDDKESIRNVLKQVGLDDMHISPSSLSKDERLRVAIARE